MAVRSKSDTGSEDSSTYEAWLDRIREDMQDISGTQLTMEYDSGEYTIRDTEVLAKQRREDRKMEKEGGWVYNALREMVRAGETSDDYAPGAFGEQNEYVEQDEGEDREYGEHNADEDGEFIIDEFMTSQGPWVKKQDEEGREQYLKQGEPMVDYGEDEDTWQEQLETARKAYKTAKSHKLPGEDD